MARKYLVNLDLAGNQLLNAVVQNLASDPGSPVEGQIWWNTTSHTLKARNNSGPFDIIDGGAIAQSKTGQLTLTGGLVVNTTGITGNKEINLTGTGASSVAGNFTGVILIASGNTGATAASRYAGATASAAPGSGTYATGDFIISQTGDVYVCTTGGTPGTWARVGSYLLAATNTWSGTSNTFSTSTVFNAAMTGSGTINLTGTGAGSVGGTFSATQHIATGQTGAATSTKYAGGNASGAPGSGTFATGDWTVTTGGDIYICSSGGTPGTWVRVGSYLLGANNTWTGTNAFNNSVTGTGSITMTNTVQGTALIPSGLTGATSASRYVGATASGAPGSGTFATGDFVIAQSGSIYICTAGGSPGTWSPVSGSSGYTTIKANGGAAITARATINFINGTYTTATAVDNASQSDVKFDVVPGNITPNLLGLATADWSNNSKRITNLLDPSAAQDAATKAYVDSVATGLDVKASVRAASTATVTVTYNATGGTSARGQMTAMPNTIDGVTLAANDRVLLKDQSTGAQNGIWVVTTLGTGANGVWDRATDFDQDAEVTSGAFTFVSEGTVNADSGWVLTTNDPIIIGGASGTALAFAQFSGAGQVTAGAGMTKTGNTLNVIANANNTIVVNADDITVNRTGTSGSHVAVLFTTATHSSATSVAITHNLGQQWVVAQVFDVATSTQVECDVVLTSTTVTTFNFATAPSANSLRFVIWG